MKSFFYLCVVILFVSCSTSPEKKAQNLVKQTLKEEMPDFKSYESISWSSLDSTFTEYIITDEGQMLANNIEALEKKARVFLDDVEWEQNNYRPDRDKIRTLLDSAQYYIAAVNEKMGVFEENEKQYVPEHDGWEITHKFKCNDDEGEKTTYFMTFYLDKDIKEVVEAEVEIED